jgi:uncharacterized Fe-S cluster-containing protein
MNSALTIDDLPGADCGVCGFRSCAEMAQRLADDATLIRLCIPYTMLQENNGAAGKTALESPAPATRGDGPAFPMTNSAAAHEVCGACAVHSAPSFAQAPGHADETVFRDSLGRSFDFFLEHFPEDPGPREIIIPHNPILTREMDIQAGDILIGRPLGMSCGCPITHCGLVMDADHRTGVIVWCVTGPLQPRQHGFKDLGYYIAEGYEGLVTESNCDLKIGMRYFFQPRMCMLQWRHSGLINYMNRTPAGTHIRIEGLWIG